MTPHFAYLKYSNIVYYSRVAGSFKDLITETPVTRLIEGIWDHFPQNAFHLLRARIFANYPLTPLCRSSIKLAAKRVTPLDPVSLESILQHEHQAIEVIPTRKDHQSLELPEADSTEALIRWMENYPFLSNCRPIIAVLTDPTGRPKIASVNTSSTNRLLHAEVNLLRAWTHAHQNKVPAGYKIWVSLKPCVMCASHISTCCEDGAQTYVTYLKDDPGPKARHEGLIQMSLLK